MEKMEESKDEDSQPHQMRRAKMASAEAWVDKRLLANRRYARLHPSHEQSQSIPCRLPMLDGLLRVGIVNEEPPYAEPHVRWCERSENEVGRKLLRFPPTRFAKFKEGISGLRP